MEKACCLSGQTAWSLLALVGAGTAMVIAISSGKWEKNIFVLSERAKFCTPKIDSGGTNKDDTNDGGTKVDRISELPDDLLSNILSRLPVIDAARTRILSRRWQNICVHRSRLSFDCLNMLIQFDRFHVCEIHRSTEKREKCRFLKAIDPSLNLYMGQKITSVEIRCCFGKECFSYIGQWVHSLAGLGIEELSLKFWCPGAIDILNEIGWSDDLAFSFQLLFEVVSLKRLYLSRCVLQPSFNGQFNYLKILVLYEICLNRNKLPGILSSCPNLLSLTISECVLDPQLCISGPCRLEFLRIYNCTWLELIDIKVTTLITFEFLGLKDEQYKLSCVPKLENLYVSIEGRDTVPYMFGEVAKDCPGLKSLTFQTMTSKGPYLSATMDLFRRLRQLDLLMTVHSQMNLLHLTPILGGCPLLEKFNVTNDCLSRSEESGGVWPTAPCHTHLKEMEFCGRSGTRNLIEFILYLLKSAPALELLSIKSLLRRYVGNGKFTKIFSDHNNYVQHRKLIYGELQQQAISPECIRKVRIV